MLFLSTFWWYVKMSMEFVYAPPFCFFTLPLAISLVASIVRQKPFRRDTWKRTYWVCIVQFLLFLATILVAAMGGVDWRKIPFPGPNRLGLYANNALTVLSLGLGTYWVVRMKGTRWFALSATLLQVWFLWGAGFVAAMSLTGTWL